MRSRGARRADRGLRPDHAVAPRRVSAVVALALLLTGCGVRLDGPPPPLPSAAPAEAMRQSAAERAAFLTDIAAAAAPVAPTDRAALERVADDARTHLVALGGLWTPPGWATPAPSVTTPSPPAGGTPSPSPAPGPAQVVEALTEAADATCFDAIGAQLADLAVLLASICVAERRSVADLGGSVPDLPGSGRSEDEAQQVLLPAVAGIEDADDLARALDAAGFALEVAAARAEPGTRSALAARASTHRESAELLVQAVGSIGTGVDPRLAAYALGPGGVDPAGVEAAVLRAWTAVVGGVTGEAREAVLAEMSRAAEAAHEWGAPHDPLPGLAT